MKKKISFDTACIIFSLIVIICIWLKGTDKSNIPHFEEVGYSLCEVTTDGAKKGAYYRGVISDEEYEKWINGSAETIWIEKADKLNYGYRLNRNRIISIVRLPWSEYRRVLLK